MCYVPPYLSDIRFPTSAQNLFLAPLGRSFGYRFGDLGKKSFGESCCGTRAFGEGGGVPHEFDALRRQNKAPAEDKTREDREIFVAQRH